MARIRSIFPGLWTDEAFAFLPDAAALIFIGLWNECDDNGIFEWKPSTIKLKLRSGKPETPADIEARLSELEAADLIMRFELDGKKLGAVRNFAKWQRPKTPIGEQNLSAEVRKYVGLNADGTRPHAGTGRPPAKPPSELLPNSTGTTSEESPQREEGGDTREKEPLPETGETFPNTAPSQASGAASGSESEGSGKDAPSAASGDGTQAVGDLPPVDTIAAPETASATSDTPEKPEEPDPDEIPANLDRRRYPEAFEELWLAYRPIASPNATKADACTAWKRLSAADKAACLVGLRAYVAWLQAERRRGETTKAKHLATFINRRGWETAGEGAAAPAGGGVETTWVLVECQDWARCEAHYRAEHSGRPPPRTSGIGGMGWRFPTTWLEQEAA